MCINRIENFVRLGTAPDADRNAGLADIDFLLDEEQGGEDEGIISRRRSFHHIYKSPLHTISPLY